MELLRELWRGLLDIPLFLLILFFKSGIYSVVMWFNIVFCLVMLYFETKGNKKEMEATEELLTEKENLKKLKRYAKS